MYYKLLIKVFNLFIMIFSGCYQAYKLKFRMSNVRARRVKSSSSVVALDPKLMA